MPGQDGERLYVATSLADALAALAERGRTASVLAGATWTMRAPLRHEPQDLSYVAISKIDELRRVEVLNHEISIGACVTHAELANALAFLPECSALVQAAGNSANPAIRNVATIGGNLCASAFAAADLVPALICLDAELEIARPDGSERLTVERFLEIRSDIEPGRLVRRVIVPRTKRRSAHIRLPLRKAGDYPVASVSLAATLGPTGIVESARLAVGSVEPVARRWPLLEAGLVGRALDPRHAAEQAERLCGDFSGRDGIEAPGWYRVKVLPSLVRRAVLALQEQS
ncbi:FAD binding domain-containing protein [Mesorhizobium sp.]|uniref:FAD binding domain-containing protein n=1 Tax=Mesorhizobium sp. TaxID=1871066 RepID=UPI0012251914|nr:FAD binding domain-containing protein [Mesorhizobium sp.]TIO10834.1 MAG: FAD-binding molybdopterin dehydrogenase [Mesorhizobium sp.]TIO35222.1 MAG: FAD-binding molybdopterin dehydrogenase [Mesorhizobium sp.]TIP13283.1 MAG: FAD-binding molybdopterin dehydrogenase [Mesorhizobium sp.]